MRQCINVCRCCSNFYLEKKKKVHTFFILTVFVKAQGWGRSWVGGGEEVGVLVVVEKNILIKRLPDRNAGDDSGKKN